MSTRVLNIARGEHRPLFDGLERAGFSADDIASIVGVSARAVRDWSQGRTRVPPAILALLTLVLESALQETERLHTGYPRLYSRQKRGMLSHRFGPRVQGEPCRRQDALGTARSQGGASHASPRDWVSGTEDPRAFSPSRDTHQERRGSRFMSAVGCSRIDSERSSAEGNSPGEMETV